MNIGLFTETYYPEINGVATSVYMLKRELEEIGHTVYVFTTTTPGAPEYEHNVFRVPSLPCILITERRIGLFYQQKLASLIKKLNLDIIHTHTEFSLGIFGRIMAKELKIPMIHTYHTIYEDYTHYVTHFKPLDKRAKAFVRVFTKICCNTVEQVIVPTDKVKELLLQYSVSKDISVIPTGVDLKKFNPELYTPEEVLQARYECGIGKEDKVLLYIGRISKEKNIAEIIEAMPDYMHTRPEIRFLIIGGGPEMERLKNRTVEMGLADRILFAGPKPWDKIGLYYQIGDVFVSASRSETQGLTYIEAMAAGLPVVARQDKCLDDILINGHNGYDFTNKEELIKGLDKILLSTDDIPYSENAIAKMRKFSTEEFARNVQKVYEEVMRRGPISEQRAANEAKKIHNLFRV
ncbi:glycosyl transferase family 1 [Anaerocolumna cellulosilytica]|uniref:Glycosyl transferase family 1 n=1 Tax=Anaerocolumna cellulosilytica TaxID=433286 RepID=A0A6S6R122_9FIRM|nr:glycosyltransferase family 4 protein [Anaerocolumna cellulosilytica]MBB5195664.1 1,2-diacylglycerol 3-alpha-glucosyltransferase [Anaerocolumna cellulosilytica]BCJ93000.1 glycosyl transferase family 1 [Anaerocolumna cellulosilytica]